MTFGRDVGQQVGDITERWTLGTDIAQESSCVHDEPSAGKGLVEEGLREGTGKRCKLTVANGDDQKNKKAKHQDKKDYPPESQETTRRELGEEATRDKTHSTKRQ